MPRTDKPKVDLPEHLLTTEQAAKLARRHVNYIRYLIRKEQVTATKFGRDWVIDRQSLLDYLSRSEQKGQKRGPKS